VSQWGDIVQTVTLALLVYELTGSGLGVVAVVAAEIVPVLLFAPLAGALVDRLPRVKVMVVADLARAALVATLVLTQDHLSVRGQRRVVRAECTAAAPATGPGAARWAGASAPAARRRRRDAVSAG